MATRELIDIILRLRKEGTGARDTKSELEGLGKSAGKAESGVSGLGDTMGKLAVIAGGAAAAFVTLKKAYDFAKEGAAIGQTKESFDRLMDSMGVAPGVLGRLREASKGTVDDMTIMSSTLTLLAGTSKELGSAMIDAAPQLMEIAKAAHKLNPSLGDTAFLYQSLATGIKRASPMILDNLGLTIKVGDAQEQYAKSIGKSVEQLTAEEKQMALLSAALEAGDRLIQQVGGSVDEMGDAFARLEVQTKNATDSAKSQFAEWILTAGDTANQLVIMAEAGMAWVGAALSGADATQAFNDAMLRQVGIEAVLSDETKRVSDKWANYADALNNEVRPATLGLADDTEYLALQSEMVAEAMKDRAAKAADDFRDSLDLLHAVIAGGFGAEMDNYMAALADLDAQLANNEITASDYADAIRDEADAFRENTNALLFNIAEKQILDALEKGLIEDVNASGTAYDEATTALWSLAEQMGLVDDATLVLMEATQDATQAFIDGKTNAGQLGDELLGLSGAALDADGNINTLRSRIDGLQSKRVNIEVHTAYTSTGDPNSYMGSTPGRIGGEQEGFQHGGQFIVRGGAGVDRVPVFFRATRGEVVTVTPPGGTPPPNPAVTNNYNLTLNTMAQSQGVIRDFGIMQSMIG